MRSFVAVLALFAVALIVAALLAYPAWVLVELVRHEPIHRVVHRVAMLCAALGLIWLFRLSRLINREFAGFALPQRQFWLQLVAGMISGALIILPLLATLQILDIRVADPRVDLSTTVIATVIAKGLVTGLFVATVEEIFFRGYLFAAITRESGRVLAMVLPSLLYASLHFLDGRLHVPADQIGWSSGLAVLASMFNAYSSPLEIADSFLALSAVGLLLAIVRARTGAIAACIGLHAAWVCALYYCEVTTQLNTASAAKWLVGSYDGMVGWATVVWIGTMACVYIAVARTTRSSFTKAPQRPVTADHFPGARLQR